MSEIRPLTTHPTFVPLLCVLAALLAIGVVAAIWEPVAVPVRHEAKPFVASARPAPQVRRSAVSSAGSVRSVRLAREAGGPDRVTVTLRGTDYRLVLNSGTRIVVPYAGRLVIGGPGDLLPGQRVDVELADGSSLVDGAAIGEIRVAGETSTLTTA